MNSRIGLQVGKWIISGDEDEHGCLRVWIKHEDESLVVNERITVNKDYGEWTTRFWTRLMVEEQA